MNDNSTFKIRNKKMFCLYMDLTPPPLNTEKRKNGSNFASPPPPPLEIAGRTMCVLIVTFATFATLVHDRSHI